MAAVGPPTKHYRSTFKVPKLHSDFSSVVALTFDSYRFIQTFCTVNFEGKIMLGEKSEPETILVVKGWQKFAQDSAPAGVSTGSYLSKGFSKYAFQVSCLALLPYSSADSFVLNRVFLDRCTMHYFKPGHWVFMGQPRLKTPMISLRSLKSYQWCSTFLIHSKSMLHHLLTCYHVHIQ